VERIAIFGSTGAVGRRIVQQALERGIVVVAYARRPEKLGELQDRVELVVGELADADAIDRAVRGADAVVSALGPTTLTPGRRPLTVGMGHVVDAMQRHGVRRVLALATPSLRQEGDATNLLLSPVTTVVQLFGSTAYDELRGTERVLRESGLDWTLARVPFLTNAAGTGRIRAGRLERTTGATLSRDNLASWMLDEAVRGDWIGQAPVVCDA